MSRFDHKKILNLWCLLKFTQNTDPFPNVCQSKYVQECNNGQKIWNKSEVLLEHVGEHIESLGNMLTTHWNLIGTHWEQQKSSMPHFKNGTPTVSKEQNAHLFPFFGDAPKIDGKIC
jgi:hypothetical protein